MFRPAALMPSLFAIFLGALAYHYSLGEHSYWPLLWLAPLPLCVYALGASARGTLAAGFGAFFLGSSAWLAGSSFPPDLLQILLWGNFLSAVAFSLSLALFRYTARHLAGWAAGFVFAFAWTSYEFVGSLFSRGGTIASLAYTQTTNLPIIQVASITGIWGVTFLVCLVPAGIAVAWSSRRNPRICRQAWWPPLVFLAAFLLFGAGRLYAPESGSNVKVGIAAEPMTLEQMVTLRSGRDSRLAVDLLAAYIRNIGSLAQAGARVVLLPEKIFPAEGHYDFLHPLGLVAHLEKVHLVVGMTRQMGPAQFNSAFVFSPEGKMLPTYDKQHLLPPYESQYTPGSNPVMVASPSQGLWGVAICKDMDFVEPAMEYSRQGVQLLLVPALDFHDDAWSHGRVAIMRGVEGNFAVARAGQWGLLTLSDSRGRIIAMKSTDANPGESLLGEVRLGEGKSVYSRLGNWAGWICVLGLALSGFMALRHKFQHARAPHSRNE